MAELFDYVKFRECLKSQITEEQTPKDNLEGKKGGED
jgi:hypothetical protein